ncbi:MAG TPA: hypothetical protein VK524_02285 [Polyangiaceae bacterium]|nr:hypothetical protein [Polyangiaceae bacterium]
MDRFTNINQTTIDNERAASLAGSNAGEDEDLDARIDTSGMATTDPSGLLVDRRTREHVAYYEDESGAWLPSPLKQNDDVLCDGGIPMRIIGPGRGRDWIYAWCKWDDVSINEAFTINLTMIVDRAPADPNETPMPLIPEPAQQAMFARAATGTETAQNPKTAAKAEHKQARADRRDLHSTLRELVEAQTPDKGKRLRKALHDKGLL